ncbi:MAG: dTMP kinase [Desulfuromonadales bacterium]
MGYFITFEGVEGCGKTTQVSLLAERLTAHGFSVIQTREPGGCAIADKIRTILLDAGNNDMSSMSELLLYSAARAQHVSEVILPALSSEKVVICDRFSDATIAYQGYGRGIKRSIIDSLNSHACQGITADLTLLIDCNPEIGLQRARQRIEASSGPREERFELEELKFHRLVRTGYLQLAAAEARRIAVIDGNDSIEEISSAIAVQVLARIPEVLRAVC